MPQIKPINPMPGMGEDDEDLKDLLLRIAPGANTLDTAGIQNYGSSAVAETWPGPTEMDATHPNEDPRSWEDHMGDKTLDLEAGEKRNKVVDTRPGDIWKTATGKYGAMNQSGEVQYFDDNRWAGRFASEEGRGPGNHEWDDPEFNKWLQRQPDAKAFHQRESLASIEDKVFYKHHKNGEVWQTDSGKWGAKNQVGRVGHFKDQVAAREYSHSHEDVGGDYTRTDEISTFLSSYLPNSMISERNYKREYALYHSRPDQKKRRAQRNKTRRKLERSGKVHKGDGKDIHHRNRNTADLRSKNLAVISKSKNRSMKEAIGSYHEDFEVPLKIATIGILKHFSKASGNPQVQPEEAEKYIISSYKVLEKQKGNKDVVLDALLKARFKDMGRKLSEWLNARVFKNAPIQPAGENRI